MSIMTVLSITSIIIGVTALVNAEVDAPQSLRLALVPNGMVVSWSTNGNTSSIVKFGPTANLSATAHGSSTTYTGATRVFHNVVVPSLSPSSTYYYVCGSTEGGWSRMHSFVTAPSVGDPRPVRLATFGDMGVKNSEGTVASLTQTLDDYDLVIHLGDFAYADDDLLEKNYEDTWNSWQELVEPITSQKAYHSLPGNHDVDCHSYGDFFCPDGTTNFTVYNHRFRMPSAESHGVSNMWHSFTYGSVHFIMIDTETDIGPHSPEGVHSIWKSGGFGDQLAWLESDLKAASLNRQNVPWIVVSGHRPMYTTSPATASSLIWPNVTQRLRSEIETLMHSHGVDLYLCGHVHAYERTYPIYQGEAVSKNYSTPSALTHLVVGSAGNTEGVSDFGPATPWLAYRQREEFGYGVLSFENRTTVKWEFLSSDSNEVLDSFTLTRNH